MSAKDDLLRDPGRVLGTITQWAIAAEAINLGQGFPELSMAEQSVAERLHYLEKVRSSFQDYTSQQYKHPFGTQELREAIAANDHKFYGLNTNPDTDVLVTLGACSAISLALKSILKQDDERDEVLLIEPYFNFYHSHIQNSGGTVNHFGLEPDSEQNWILDVDKLEASITDRTKVILLNTPMNPTGKVFSRDELEALADVVERHDLYVVSDEVYEFFTTPDQPHITPAAIERIKDRCVRVGSIGKTFSVTDWRVGYATGPKDIIQDMGDIHFYLSCGVSGAFQNAATYGFQQDEFLKSLGEEYKAKAAILAEGLRKAGFKVSPAQGGYFLSASYRDIADVSGVDFVEHMIHEHGVAAIPFSPTFLQPQTTGNATQFLRFCVAKPERVLRDAVQRLQGIGGP